MREGTGRAYRSPRCLCCRPRTKWRPASCDLGNRTQLWMYWAESRRFRHPKDEMGGKC